MGFFYLIVVPFTALYMRSIMVCEAYIGHHSWRRLHHGVAWRYVIGGSVCFDDKKTSSKMKMKFFMRSAITPPDEAEEAHRPNKKLLDGQSGVKPLSNKQLKWRNKLESGIGSHTENDSKKGQRTPLSEIHAGAKLQGVVTGVKSYGIHVDVGAEVNGLVHIKDVSKDYFYKSTDIEKQYRKRQELEVWVKFVDIENNKIGFQLFPVSEDAPYASAVNVMECQKGDPVTGRVKRVATHGLFIDVGNGVEAFLNRRKMKYPQNRFGLMPWEVHPLGSDVSGYLVAKEEPRKRIEITTYAPEVWGRYEVFKEDMEDEDVDDVEACGRNNADSSKEPSGKVDGDMAGKQMTPEDIYEDMCAGQELAHITIEEMKNWPYLRHFFEEKLIDLGTLGRLMAEANPDQPGQLSPEHMEHFVEILQDALGLADEEDRYGVDEYDHDAGDSKVSTEVNVESGGDFPNETNAQLDLMGSARGTDDDDSLSQDKDPSPQLSQIDSRYKRNDDSKAEKLTKIISGVDPDNNVEEAASPNKSLDEIYTAELSIKQRTSDLFQYVFASVATSKGYVQYSDVREWDFAKALVTQGAITETEMETLFATLSEQDSGRMNKERFEAFVDELSLVDTLSSPRDGSSLGRADKMSTSLSTNTDVEDRINVASTTSGTIDMPQVLKEDNIASEEVSFGESSQDDEDVYSYDDEDDFMEMSLEEAWDDLSQGMDSVSLDDVSGWGAIADMVESGRISDVQFRTLYEQASSGKRRLKRPGFERLLDLLIPFEDDEDYFVDVLTMDGLIRELTEEPNPNLYPKPVAGNKASDEQWTSADVHTTECNNVVEELTSGEKNLQTSASNAVAGFDIVRNSQPVDVGVPLLDEAAQAENTRRVFEGLSKGKAYCTVKDLMRWDFVYTLFGEGALTEELLLGKMEARGGDRRGIPLAGFDGLVDDLVAVYEQLDSEYEAIEANMRMDAALTEGVLDSNEVVEGSMGQIPLSSDVLEEDDDVMDIDPAVEFERIRGDDGFVDVEALKDLSFVSQMITDGVLAEDDFGGIFEAAGVEDASRIDECAFAAVLEIICEQLTLNEFEVPEDDDNFEGDGGMEARSHT